MEHVIGFYEIKEDQALTRARSWKLYAVSRHDVACVAPRRRRYGYSKGNVFMILWYLWCSARCFAASSAAGELCIFKCDTSQCRIVGPNLASKRRETSLQLNARSTHFFLQICSTDQALKQLSWCMLYENKSTTYQCGERSNGSICLLCHIVRPTGSATCVHQMLLQPLNFSSITLGL